MRPEIQQELDYQKEQRDEMLNENDYKLKKGEIIELQRDAIADRIVVQYKTIIERIMREAKINPS